MARERFAELAALQSVFQFDAAEYGKFLECAIVLKLCSRDSGICSHRLLIN